MNAATTIAGFLLSLPVATGPGTGFYAGWPPERYRTEFRGTIHAASFERIQEICSAGQPPVPKGMEYLGCLRNGVIYCPLPLPGKEEPFARCVSHEAAHLRFWQWNHPL